jgi:hypothetical protein
MQPAAFRACGAIETTVARQVLSALVGGGVGGSGGAGGELMILLSRIAEQDRKLEEQAAALEEQAAALEWILQGCRQLYARVVALEQQERQVAGGQVRQQQQERQQQERLERQERQERNMALAARLTALEERLEAGLATLLEVATAVSL